MQNLDFLQIQFIICHTLTFVHFFIGSVLELSCLHASQGTINLMIILLKVSIMTVDAAALSLFFQLPLGCWQLFCVCILRRQKLIRLRFATIGPTALFSILIYLRIDDLRVIFILTHVASSLKLMTSIILSYV